ncbi:MAG: hypothetical protein IPQ16_12060 [Geobacteraceae bacterium]|nr:hypothetical protein [Geobacteraceae bacterium]
MSSLFSTYGQVGSYYETIRTSTHQTAINAVVFAEEMWNSYEPYADSNFVNEFKVDIYARFWEMYLTCLLLSHGKPIRCLKPGPDILIDESNLKWIEAIAPSGGVFGSPDSVPEMVYGGVATHPEQQIILRYTSSIREKFDNKYVMYSTNGINSNKDSFIIAINSSKIPQASYYSIIPEIVKAVLPVGHLQAKIDTRSGRVVESSYQYRPIIYKTVGSGIATTIFLDDAYNNLSGIIFSNVTILNASTDPFTMFIHNPNASNPIPEGYFNFSREYIAKEYDDHFELVFTDNNP